MRTLKEDIADVINRYSRENRSNTPDFILAEMLSGVLGVFEMGIRSRDKWYGIAPEPGKSKEPGIHVLYTPATLKKVHEKLGSLQTDVKRVAEGSASAENLDACAVGFFEICGMLMDDVRPAVNAWQTIQNIFAGHRRVVNPGDDVVIFERDGNQLCAHRKDFVNLQESLAGFGKTYDEAMNDLLRQEREDAEKNKG